MVKEVLYSVAFRWVLLLGVVLWIHQSPAEKFAQRSLNRQFPCLCIVFWRLCGSSKVLLIVAIILIPYFQMLAHVGSYSMSIHEN
jgi:hypothetical protein